MTQWWDLEDEEEQALARFMSQVAALPGEGRAMDPMQLWWKAQLLRRWDAERYAELPLDVMDVVRVAGAAAAAALFLMWFLPAMLRMTA